MGGIEHVLTDMGSMSGTVAVHDVGRRALYRHCYWCSSVRLRGDQEICIRALTTECACSIWLTILYKCYSVYHVERRDERPIYLLTASA